MMNIYGKLNESTQYIGGNPTEDMILMNGERPSSRHVARANGKWEIDLGNEMVRLLREVNSIYKERMNILTESYPLEERESFNKQIKEAEAFLADENSFTPWLDACAKARSISKSELSRRILEKDLAFSIMHGTLTGIRQVHEDNILALEHIWAADLYDPKSLWPEEEEINDI